MKSLLTTVSNLLENWVIVVMIVIPDETTTVVVNNVCAMEITLPSSSAMTDSIATDVGGCLTY
ncbi:hypothetical protein OUZ56_025331 [Daphnia magna]|uniref:Uncharacterized protein n=1 Tax=Daphnia magna TaxID=35525 RepID=A0ABQ9ZJN3_9CRUS|nr:hypothetical protein OUZ56_025331 [Daphnia magna]